MSIKTSLDQISRFMTYVLRHHPDDYKLVIDKSGYVPVDDLLNILNKHFRCNDITIDVLIDIVKNNDKKRFSFSEDMKLIRANQGHSQKVGKSIDPNKLLTEIKDAKEITTMVHGTDYTAWRIIKNVGLNKMSRQFIHFANGTEKVISGMRKSSNVRIFVDVEKMLKDKIKIWKSDNDVLLTDGVNGVLDPKYFKEVHILDKGKWTKI